MPINVQPKVCIAGDETTYSFDENFVIWRLLSVARTSMNSVSGHCCRPLVRAGALQTVLLCLLLLVLAPTGPSLVASEMKTVNGHKLPFNVLVVMPEFECSYDKFGITMSKARPVIDISVADAVRAGIIGADYLNFTFHDSRYWQDPILAERHSTVGVVDAYCAQRLDAILGFTDSYSLATVTKVTAGFGQGVPVITTAGMVSMLGDQRTFPFLTRMQGSYYQMADSMYKLIAYNQQDEPSRRLVSTERSRSKYLGYRNLVLLYHDKRRAINRPRMVDGEPASAEFVSSHCYFSLYAIKNFFTEKSAFFKEAWKIQTPSLAFDEDIPWTHGEVKSWLKIVADLANGENIILFSIPICTAKNEFIFELITPNGIALL